ncbi:MAG: ZrgA family zinc uptake protein [Endozoicomonas sp.]
MRTPFGMAAVAACVLVFTGNAAAHKHHNHEEVRHAGAHVHGQGELNFAVEDSELHMELMMPAHDILGFESITTEAQQQQLNDALKKLESESLWQLSAEAQCQLSSAHASTTGHEDHGHGDDKKHNHSHDHGHKHNHKDDHDHDHEDSGGHMDIAVTYVFECSSPGRLNQFSTKLFETFPRSEKIHVQGFTSSGQLSEIITADQPQVRF